MYRVLYKACPLCSGPFIKGREADCSGHPIYDPGLPATIEWMVCTECGHNFTSGYWSQEGLALLFKRTHENQRPGYDLERQRHVSASMIDRVLNAFGDNWQPTNAGWLDVGFGNAALLLTAYEYGFVPTGLDLRQENVDQLNNTGIEAYCLDITDFKTRVAFSVISMADVLEHMPFPEEGLKAARRLLRGGGMLFISLPAAGSQLWDILDANNANPYWGEIEHYHNFSRERLYALLRETRFTPLRYGVSERYRCCMEIVARAN